MCRWYNEQRTEKKSNSLITAIHDAEIRIADLRAGLDDWRKDQLHLLKGFREGLNDNDFISAFAAGVVLASKLPAALRLIFKLIAVRYNRNSLDLLMSLKRFALLHQLFPPLRRRVQRAQRIVSPPGRRLLRVAEFLFSPKTVTLTFKPLIADWQFEYFEALKAKRGKWHIRMMTLRYYWYYVKACGLSNVAKFFKGFAKQ